MSSLLARYFIPPYVIPALLVIAILAQAARRMF